MKVGDKIKVIRGSENKNFPLIKSLIGMEGIIVKDADTPFKPFNGCMGVNFYPNHHKYFFDLNGDIKTETGYYVPENCLEVIGHITEKSEIDEKHATFADYLKQFDFSRLSFEKLTRIVSIIALDR